MWLIILGEIGPFLPPWDLSLAVQCPSMEQDTQKLQAKGQAQWYLHFYLTSLRATTAIQSSADLFLMSRDQALVFLDQLSSPDYLPELRKYPSHSTAALHHPSYRSNFPESQRFSQHSWCFLSLSSYLLWIVFVRQLALVASPSGLPSIARMVVINNFQPMNCSGEGITLYSLVLSEYCWFFFSNVKWYHWKSCLCVRVKFYHIWGGIKLVFLQFFKSTRRSYEYCQRLFLAASHLLTYCTKKNADNFFISSLDHILPPLLGNNKAHLYEVENSPGSSFCSAAVLSVIFHTAGSRCCPFPICHLFPLLQLVLCPSSVIRPLNHSHHMLIPNYLKGKKRKKKKKKVSITCTVLRAFVSCGSNQSPSQPNLCALENHPRIPCAAYAAAAHPWFSRELSEPLFIEEPN